MPWTADKTIPAMQNRSRKAREIFAEVANAALARGLSEEEAIFAGIAAANRAENTKKINKIEKPPVPQHVKAVIEAARKAKDQQEEVLQKKKINPAYLPQNTLDADTQRTVISVDWDEKGRLVLLFSDGEKIVTSPVPVSENIEQYFRVDASPIDVEVSSPLHGQVLKFDSVSGKWKNLPDDTSGDAAELNPVFTYNDSGDIIRIDYSSGNYKVFSYNLDGDISTIDYVKGSVTYRKTFVYSSGILVQIIDSFL